MPIEYRGLSEITGPLAVMEGIPGVSFNEIVEFHMDSGELRTGRVVMLSSDRVVIQVFEGTKGMSLDNSRVHFTGSPSRFGVSREILGRTFDGAGRPADGLGSVFADELRDINGLPINPVSRYYPRNCIYTGISAIDGMCTLIRGQKLPIFSGAGMSHNQLAAQIARQAKLGSSDEEFAIVFAAIGVKNDAADFFRRAFEESGVLQRVVIFLNLANDPIIERIITPRVALTAAEYFAFKLGMHVLVILTDMTSYCEALRELSSSKGEIPSRKGFPSYMYSDLASIYERAGMIKGIKGSVTLMPILTMPNDDINHPIPDLTGYITEGQIVLDRLLDSKGIVPPVAVLSSLSRLMKDGIGEGYTREDHPALANQLFSLYAHVQEVRALASVIGEDELTAVDRSYMEFGRRFEQEFIRQSPDENRTLEDTLDLGWKLVSTMPISELDRIETDLLKKYYKNEEELSKLA